MPDFKNEFTYKTFVENGKEDEFDGLFDSAVKKVKSSVLGAKFPLCIDGKEHFSKEVIAEYSPIDGSLIGTFQRATRDDARTAIDAALVAFDGWRDTDYRERVRIFRKAAGIFSRDKFIIAAILSIENGKTRYESVGEVDEAIDFLNYYSLEMERNKGYSRRAKLAASTKSVGSGFQGAPGREERITVAMKPYGVFGVIAPFNFPISISTGMSTGALITGNTVVFKPSSTDNMAMLTGFAIYKVFEESGLPKGVFNYVTGPGSEVGDELVSNGKVSGIAFTGSKKTGLGMIAKSFNSGQQKVFVVEMGGKNPVVVSKYANLDYAVDGIASSAFGYAGQKCSACSRVYVHISKKEQFLSKLVEKARAMAIGDPLAKGNYIGPLISASALERYRKSVLAAKSEGRVVYGGGVVGKDQRDLYVEPVIAELGQQSRLMHDELFLPFLVVDTYKEFDEALSKANDSEYGLCAGLYSEKKGEVREFLGKMQAGVIYVNREIGATTGAIVGAHTFVGWKGSGLTGKGTGSRFYLEQFMREQSRAEIK